MCASCGLALFTYDGVPLAEAGFSIRLAKIHPASGFDADIVLELVAFNENKPEYEALSWCWGASRWDRPVRVRCDTGDKCISVSSNLESALRHIRLADKFRVIWIDAVCINQLSTEERNRQVLLMSDFYGKATRVRVWLGDGDSSSERAFSFIKDSVLGLHNFDSLCANAKHSDSWMDMIHLMERPWFSRRWVIQEIIQANQKTALIMCGNDVMKWAEFAEAVSLFDMALAGPLSLTKLDIPQLDNVSYSIRYAPALGAIQLVKASSDLFRASHHENRPAPLRSLEYLVCSFTMYESSEPRDVIFSLLSISKDAFRLDEQLEKDRENEEREKQVTPFDHLPTTQRILKAWYSGVKVRQAFKVDYVAPVLEVYKQFIAFSISKADPSRALDIICRPWAPELTDVEFPSWISTLANAPYKLIYRNELGKRLVRRNPDPLVGKPDSPNYSASRNIGVTGHEVFKYWSAVSRSMFLRGFVLDEVQSLAFPSQLGHIPHEWPAMADWDLKEDPPEEFWRTLVADRGPDGQDPLPFYPRACKHVFQHAIDDTLDTSMIINYGSSILANFIKRVQEVIWNRRLMKTKRAWLGLAPKGARPGDLICIIYGCSVPVLLRRMRKNDVDIALEMEDEKARRHNAAEYIARQLASVARMRTLRRKNGMQSPQVQMLLAQRGSANLSSARSRARSDIKPRPRSEYVPRRHTVYEDIMERDEIGLEPGNWDSRPDYFQSDSTFYRRKLLSDTKEVDLPNFKRSQTPALEVHGPEEKTNQTAEGIEEPLTAIPSTPPSPISSSGQKKRRVSDANRDAPPSKRRPPSTKQSLHSAQDSKKVVSESSKSFYYTLVGECYLHGMMRGEAISFRSRFNPTKPIEERMLPETFELR